MGNITVLHKHLSGFNSLFEVVNYFSTEDVCRQYLKHCRFGKYVVCPHCGSIHCYEFSDGIRFKCHDCDRIFSILVGTIFENTKIPLRKWFIAMYLLSCHGKGISSVQLSRDLDITQKSAWYMLQKLRSTFKSENDGTLSSDVECDETYIGGREINKHESKRTKENQGRSIKVKTPVFGMVERGGRVVARRVENTSSKTLNKMMGTFIIPESRVLTDEWVGYHNVERLGYVHEYIRHKEKEFAVGDVNTNTIEGLWAILKKMLLGTYHVVSVKHLQKYVDEAVFRYNHRDKSASKRFEIIFANAVGRHTYADVRLAA